MEGVFNLVLESVSPSVPSVLDFLKDGLENGLSLSTLKVLFSALSVFLDLRLLEDPMVKLFLLATEKHLPLASKVFPPWNSSLVLNHLTSSPFEPLSDSSIKCLTWKMTVLPNRVILRPEPLYLPKVSIKFHRSQ